MLRTHNHDLNFLVSNESWYCYIVNLLRSYHVFIYLYMDTPLSYWASFEHEFYPNPFNMVQKPPGQHCLFFQLISWNILFWFMSLFWPPIWSVCLLSLPAEVQAIVRSMFPLISAIGNQVRELYVPEEAFTTTQCTWHVSSEITWTTILLSSFLFWRWLAVPT